MSFKNELCLEMDDTFSYFIIDFDTYDYNELISSSVGYPVNIHIFYI